jgi:hypothetical protein
MNRFHAHIEGVGKSLPHYLRGTLMNSSSTQPNPLPEQKTAAAPGQQTPEQKKAEADKLAAEKQGSKS